VLKEKWIDQLRQDLRFGWRMLRRAPAVSLFAIVAIALGIGINTMVFSLANAVLFKRLPGSQGDGLVFVGTINTQRGGDIEGVSWPEFLELRARLQAVQLLAGAAQTAADLNDGGQAEALQGEQITPDALRALGLRTLAGRALTEADAKPGAPAVAMLAERVWRTRYSADPAVVGRTVKLNGVPTTIVGVAEQAIVINDGFTGVWTPFVPAPHWNRTWRRLTVFGRLAPGVDEAGANAEVAAIAATFAREFPETNRDVPFVVKDFRGYALPARVSLLFLVMLGAVGFVLLVACANVANLMLARAVGRAREVAVRTAIGASRGRIVRQLLIENLILSVAGGALGLAIAMWGVGVFDRALVDAGRPLWLDFSVDLTVLVYLAVIVGVTTLLFGLAPAWRLSRIETMTVMKEGSQSAGRRRGRVLMSTLVVAEMTLAVILLAGAGVMIRSFLNVYRVQLGFDREGLMTFRLNTARNYQSDAQRERALDELTQRLRALPGVEAAAVATSLPLQNFTRDAVIQLGPGSSGQLEQASLVATLGSFDRAIGAPVREGRFLNAADYTPRPTVAVVNETFAVRSWPGQSAIGKQFRLAFGKHPPVWLTVVGVIPDIALHQRRVPRPFCFVPYSFLLETDIGVVIRSRAEPAALFGEVRRTVREMDPELAILNLDTFDHAFYVSQWPQRVFGALFTTFGVVALLLASVGLYGVTSYAASQRRHEIGVRVALGATQRNVTWEVAAGAVRQVALGLLLGLAGSAALTRLLSAQLVDVSPNDPTTLAGVAVVLTTTAIAGCLLPVRRALRVSPVEALRHE
jgi:putative ABC transport system permease protein